MMYWIYGFSEGECKRTLGVGTVTEARIAASKFSSEGLNVRIYKTTELPDGSVYERLIQNIFY